MNIIRWMQGKLVDWLNHEKEPDESLLSNFTQLGYEIRPGDVVLVEGRSRVSEVIKTITLSRWSHSVLYIGKLYDIEDPEQRNFVSDHYSSAPGEQLIIEALLGKGTIVAPLSKYEGYHLRICRAKGLHPADAQKVIAHAIRNIGAGYDVRQMLDLARFLFPWSMLPRRWHSSLFEHNAGTPTRTVCSSMLATAFASVHYPILPVIKRDRTGQLRFFNRNFRLFTPSDFDYSPYFEIIKYPLLSLNELALYRHLPWSQDGQICNDNDDCYIPEEDTTRVITSQAEVHDKEVTT
jgi:hypothetical protein